MRTPGLAPLERTRMQHKIPGIPGFAAVFSSLLPQSSLGSIAATLSACGGFTHGGAYPGALYLQLHCSGILSIYRRLPLPSRNVDTPRHKKAAQHLPLRMASANSEDAFQPLASALSHEWNVYKEYPGTTALRFCRRCFLLFRTASTRSRKRPCAFSVRHLAGHRKTGSSWQNALVSGDSDHRRSILGR